MNRREACAMGTELLQKAGVSDSSLDARYLLEWAAEMTLTEYLMYPEQELHKEQEEIYIEAIRQRSKRIPLQHITGEQLFMGLSFSVGPEVLIPRQETELLVEEGLKRMQPSMRILDLCTGSGCILVSLAVLGKERGCVQEETVLHGSDISEAALQMAEKNAERHGAHVEFYHSDLLRDIPGEYDMILSNPPYIPTEVIQGLEEEVRCHDPFLALDGKEDGLYFYRRIVAEAREKLRPGGWLLFEIGYDQGQAVMSLLQEAGYTEVCCLKDLAGLDRVVMGRYDKIKSGNIRSTEN